MGVFLVYVNLRITYPDFNVNIHKLNKGVTEKMISAKPERV
jgi:hypothetical protein